MMSFHYPDEDALKESVYRTQAKIEFDKLNARLAQSQEETKRYRDEAWEYRKVLNQIRDNPNTRHEVEAQLGGILDVLDA